MESLIPSKGSRPFLPLLEALAATAGLAHIKNGTLGMTKIRAKVKTEGHTKLKELILYVSDRCQYQPTFGATKLNKILFFSDFLAYAKFGHSITGEEYFKLEWGPAPKYLIKAREEMRPTDLEIIERPTARGMQVRLIPKRDADLSQFTPEEIALVDSVISELEDADAESVSGLSHRFRGWQIAKTKEVIPYETVFLPELQDQHMTEHEMQIVRGLEKHHGLATSVS